MRFPAAIQNLINYFSKLPTVGPKTAERYAFYLLRQDPEELQKFAQAIAELKEKTTICQTCWSIAETNPCPICLDKKREKQQICLVADTRDMLVIEAAKQYNGLYFILGGLLNAIENIGPDKLNTNQLINRLKKEGVNEIILALSPSLEGETTAMYIAKLIRTSNLKIKITRLAKGLPSGSDLEYADEITLANAFKYRNEM